MRLQLTLSWLALCATVAVARSQPATPSASATLRVYADDDRVTVWSPAARAAISAGLFDLDLDVTADAITAASVDVVTSASPATVHERRVEAGGGLAATLDRRVLVRAGAAASHERDYDALRAAVGATLELADRNTTIETRLRVGDDRAGDVTDPMFHGTRRTIGAVAVVTQILDRRTVVDVTADIARADGWHGSPYRRIAVATEPGPFPTWVREVTPAIRDSVAAAIRVRRAVGERWFVTATARGYRDDWDVASATLAADVMTERRAGTLVGVSVRGYEQRAAHFWRRRYDDATAPPHRTADRTLGPMSSLSIEAVVDRPLGSRGPRLIVALGGLSLWFDAPSQDHRLAVTATISVSWPLGAP